MDKKKSYSATEISKFTYCNYSWYYENKYTAKVLREKNKGTKDKYDISKINLSYKKGRDFHKNYYKRSIKCTTIQIRIIVVVFLIIIGYLVVKNYEFKNIRNTTNDNVTFIIRTIKKI